jgi:hypothetical protein
LLANPDVAADTRCLLLLLLLAGFCSPGGDPNGAGMPRPCENDLWTEDEGASDPNECVAPPGMYLPDSLLTAEDKKIKDCPQGTYKENWQRVGIAGCLPCGVGDWLSDKTILLNDLDPNSGIIRQQIAVRGSTDSCCEWTALQCCADA